ncbi:MAG TPA: GNAT family N-acetyltransferase [Streptosporangiaceae bacterium]|jgi:GNAT superfamily N-acetyltransferase
MMMRSDGFGGLVHRHWPAHTVEESDGWLLRYADGVTKRANSVLPAGRPADLAAAIAAAERFYRDRGLPPVFSLDEGAPGAAELDAELAARGYSSVDPTLIMTRPLDGAWDPPAHPVRLDDSPSGEWMARWWEVDGRGGPEDLAVGERILRGVPSTYAHIGDGIPDAVGRITVTGGWAGIYCMAVNSARRRAGLARAIVAALLDAARGAGAHDAYLTVVAANTPARALYAGCGFAVAGGYHYRVG